MKDPDARKREFARKLARLRREEPISKEVEGPGSAGRPEDGTSPASEPARANKAPSIPLWMRKRMQAGRARRGTAAPPLPNSPTCEVPRLTGRPGELECSPEGSYWFRRRLYPLQHVHGEWPLDSARHGSNDNFVLLTGDQALAELEVHNAVFLDTETTGLSGGAGVFVYMVGLARFTPGGLEVWQGFMDGPEQEAALLHEVANRIARSGGVVSFFGKSFDRHRLQDKMALHGIESPFHSLPHLDLYHPLRRLHKEVYADSRLQTMERALCGLIRPDDLPGALAPEAWFDYLAGRPHRLEGVFRHNCDDVLSLVTLLAWLAGVDRRELSKDAPVPELARELALCEALSSQKNHEAALLRAQNTLSCFAGLEKLESAPNEPSMVTASLRLLQAENLRRLHRGSEAMASLQPLLDLPGVHVESVRARALASKILERELGDGCGALQMCLEARGLLERLRDFSGRLALERDVIKRADRLAKAREAKS